MNCILVILKNINRTLRLAYQKMSEETEEFVDVESKASDTSDQIRDLKDEVVSLEILSENNAKQAMQLKDELVQSIAEYLSSLEVASKLKETIDKIDDEKNQLQAELATLRDQKNDLTSRLLDVQDSQNDASKINIEKQQVELQLQDSGQENQKLASRIKELEQLSVHKDAMITRLSDSEQELNQAKTRIESLQLLENDRELLKTQLEEKQQEIENLRKDLTQITLEKNEGNISVQNQIQTINDARLQAEQERDEHKKTSGDHFQKVRDLTEKESLALNQVESLNRAVDFLKQQLDDAQSKVHDTKTFHETQSQSQSAAIQKAIDDRLKIQRELEQVTQSLRGLQEENRQLSEQLAKHRSDSSQSINSLRATSRELTEIKSELTKISQNDQTTSNYVDSSRNVLKENAENVQRLVTRIRSKTSSNSKSYKSPTGQTYENQEFVPRSPLLKSTNMKSRQ